MDYEKFAEALNSGDSKEVEALYSEAFEILCRYLSINFNADHQDAQECAQHALVMTMERLQKGAIRNKKSLFSYLLKSAKNHYVRMKQEQEKNSLHDNIERYIPIQEQADLMVTEERKKALQSCLAALDEPSREFILYWLENPDAKSGEVAQNFNITVNNVWTKRHRIIKKLNKCVRKKINQ